MPMTLTNTPDRITHAGHVTEVFESGVDVAIVSEAACGSCTMKRACGMDESKEKIITVFTPDANAYRVGEEVTVSMTQAMGTKAILYVYILPVIVILTVLVVLIQTGVSEMISGLVALAMLVVYYLSVYLLRNRIEREIRFQINKKDNNQP